MSPDQPLISNVNLQYINWSLAGVILNFAAARDFLFFGAHPVILRCFNSIDEYILFKMISINRLSSFSAMPKEVKRKIVDFFNMI